MFMKNYLLLFSLVLLSYTNVKSQCSDLFISEYVEGWSDNRTLELYNPTNKAIDLSGYTLSRYSNGATTGTTPVPLAGSLGAYKTYVIEVDLRDTAGSGNTAPVWEELQAYADTFICPDYNANSTMYFNGNDAMVLEKTNATIVDIFGKVGEDPGGNGYGWTDTYPYNDPNKGTVLTADHTLIRKHTVKSGVSSNPSYFNALAEWDTLPANTFDSLGAHTCDCYTGAASVKEITYNDNVFFFPNPSLFGKTINVKATSVIECTEIYNTSGELVCKRKNNSKRGEMQVDLSGIQPSMYFVRIVFDNKRSVIRELSIN